jgi:2-polyprenyl-6-methoxyphenol hydroxylase-like FAD-dependent oxidoreductase
MLNGHSPAPKVVVVGGSLGGLFDAIALRSLGYEVDVYEKSSGLMKDRGAGIVLQGEVMEFFRLHAIATPEEVSVPVHTRRYLAPDGSVLQEGPMPQAMTSWDALYRKLRAAFGEERYHAGVRLAGFETNGETVTARFNGGKEATCNLLIGADGPGSTVRGQLLPEVRSEYAGYVAWRGVIPEQDRPGLAAEFAGRFTFFQAPHTHILCYLIPGPEGALQPGRRRLNWVWYLNTAPGDELDRVLTDKDGWRREFSVPQGLVRPDLIDWLYGEARRILPPLFFRLVEATGGPFVQTIHDLAVPQMAFGRVWLTGDAAFVPRPHTAASTAKAAANALALADCLTVAKGDVVEALRRWEPDQLEMGERLRVYGQLRQPFAVRWVEVAGRCRKGESDDG